LQDSYAGGRFSNDADELAAIKEIEFMEQFHVMAPLKGEEQLELTGARRHLPNSASVQTLGQYLTAVVTSDAVNNVTGVADYLVMARIDAPQMHRLLIDRLAHDPPVAVIEQTAQLLRSDPVECVRQRLETGSRADAHLAAASTNRLIDTHKVFVIEAQPVHHFTVETDRFLGGRLDGGSIVHVVDVEASPQRLPAGRHSEVSHDVAAVTQHRHVIVDAGVSALSPSFQPIVN